MTHSSGSCDSDSKDALEGNALTHGPEVAETGKGRMPVTTHHSDARYRCLFENNLDAVFSLDRNGRFTEANPAAERLSGYNQPELRRMGFADLCALEDRHKAMFFFARAMSGLPRRPRSP